MEEKAQMLYHYPIFLVIKPIYNPYFIDDSKA